MNKVFRCSMYLFSFLIISSVAFSVDLNFENGDVGEETIFTGDIPYSRRGVPQGTMCITARVKIIEKNKNGWLVNVIEVLSPRQYEHDIKSCFPIFIPREKSIFFDNTPEISNLKTVSRDNVMLK